MVNVNGISIVYSLIWFQFQYTIFHCERSSSYVSIYTLVFLLFLFSTKKSIASTITVVRN